VKKWGKIRKTLTSLHSSERTIVIYIPLTIVHYHGVAGMLLLRYLALAIQENVQKSGERTGISTVCMNA
jgi:hypothetical protein